MAEDDRLARLLSGRPGLSRPEKEEILDAVLAEVAPQEEVAERRGWFGVVGALVAAAAALVLVLVPGPAPEEETLTARGAGDKPVLTVVCAATSEAGRCNRGGELLFELADARRWRHAAVFAFREDDTVIWYDDDAALEHDGATVLLPLRAKLGADHPPGRYDVAAVLSTRPLDRATIRRIYEKPEAHREAVVVEAQVEVR